MKPFALSLSKGFVYNKPFMVRQAERVLLGL
jgi:hypothetical protein